MKKKSMMQHLFALLVFSFLISCSNGGSSSSCGSTGCDDTSADVFSLSGNVVDPEIAEATVRIVSVTNNQTAFVCDDSGVGICEQLSDDHGQFSFNFSPSLDVTSYEIVSQGGFDQATGMRFDSIFLRAPLSMYSQGTDFNVTPITSLVAALMRKGESYEQSLESARVFLGLEHIDALKENPMDNVTLLSRSLLLSLIIEELKERSSDDVFETVSDATGLFNIQGKIDTGILETLIDNDAVEEQIKWLEDAFVPDVDVTTLLESVKKKRLETLLGKYLINSFDGVDITDAQYKLNIAALRDALFLAISDQNIPLDSIGAQRMVRYAFFHNNITSFDNLTNSSFVSTFSSLSSDPVIAEFISTTSEIDVRVPLLFTNLLADTSSAMMTYYINSNESHLFKSEKVITYVRDNTVNDAILLSVAIGKANAGYFNEAITIINNSIYQSAYKADAYRQLADVFIQANRIIDAIVYLDKAYVLYQTIITSKGSLSVSPSDAEDLALLIRSYVDAGSISKANFVLVYYESLLDTVDYSNLSSLINGLDYLIDNIQDVYKEQYIDKLYELSLLTPQTAGSRPNDGNKVNNLLRAVWQYGEINAVAKVMELKTIIVNIRNTPIAGEHWLINTAFYSDYYMYKLIMAMVVTGQSNADIQSAISNIGTFFDDQYKSYALFMAYKSVNGDMSLDLLDEFSSASDKIEALTYYATNANVSTNRYAAYQLIENNLYNDANTVITEAVTLIDGLVAADDSDRLDDKIRYGYLKIANLYYLMNDTVSAEQILDKAQLVIDQMNPAGLEDEIPALIGVAIGYNSPGYSQVGADIKALNNLQSAELKVTAAAIDAETKADYYQDIAEAYIVAGLSNSAEDVLDMAVVLGKSLSSSGSSTDDIEDEIDQLLELADLYVDAGKYSSASAVLLDVKVLIQSLPENMQTGLFIDDGDGLVGGFVRSGDFTNANDIANSLGFTDARNEALQLIAESFGLKDDFPDTWVASVDTDKDGRPDFFHPLATASDIATTGLILDDDADGDGIVNSEDALPLWAN